MQPIVSVVVPVYQVESYLDRCIESLINQTYDNLEIIRMTYSQLMYRKNSEVRIRLKVAHGTHVAT